MVIKRNKKNLVTKFFLLGWGIYIVSYILLRQTELMYMYNTSTIYQYVKFLTIIIFSMKIIFIDKYSYKKLLCYYVILTCVFINAIYTDNTTLFFTMLIAMAADNVDFDSFIKSDIKLRVLLLITIVGLSLVGYLPNFTRFINGSLKQGFGFAHPNILCFFVITILLEMLYLNKKIKLSYIGINVFAIYMLKLFCFSRTSVLAFIVIFVANIIIKNKEKFFENKVIKKIMCILPILLASFSMVIVLGYGQGNELSLKMDKAFTGRIESSYIFYRDYGIKLLGNKIETIGTREAINTGVHSNIFDMGYCRLLIGYGLIIAIIFILLLCLLQKNIIDKKNYKLLLISTFFIIIGISENNIYNIIMNFALIYIPYIISKKDNKVGEEKYEQS